MKLAESWDQVLETLGVFPGFPMQKRAREIIVEGLARICTPDLAEQAIKERMLEEFDRWPGPQTLFATVRDAVGEAGPKTLQDYKSPTRTPEPVGASVFCEPCQGLGFFLNYASGEYIRCGCDDGARVEQTLIDSMNARRKEQKARCQTITLPPAPSRLTQTDIENVLHVKRAGEALAQQTEDLL